MKNDTEHSLFAGFIGGLIGAVSGLLAFELMADPEKRERVRRSIEELKKEFFSTARTMREHIQPLEEDFMPDDELEEDIALDPLPVKRKAKPRVAGK